MITSLYPSPVLLVTLLSGLFIGCGYAWCPDELATVPEGDETVPVLLNSYPEPVLSGQFLPEEPFELMHQGFSFGHLMNSQESLGVDILYPDGERQQVWKYWDYGHITGMSLNSKARVLRIYSWQILFGHDWWVAETDLQERRTIQCRLPEEQWKARTERFRSSSVSRKDAA